MHCPFATLHRPGSLTLSGAMRTLTTIVAVSFFCVVTLILALPTFFPVIKPLWSTDTVSLSLECQFSSMT